MKIDLVQFLLAFTIFTTIVKPSEGDAGAAVFLGIWTYCASWMLHKFMSPPTVSCRQGTYLKGSSCIPCPLNTYQDKTNHRQRSCILCPRNRVTFDERSDKLQDCRERPIEARTLGLLVLISVCLVVVTFCGVSWSSCSKMLPDGRRQVRTIEQVDELHRASQNGKDKENTDRNGPSPPTDEIMDRIVTEKELLKLAGCLPADSFTDVATTLGVGYIEQDNIRKQNQSSFKHANVQMLMKWKCRGDGGKVRDLDKALNESDCGGLSYKDM